MNTQNTPQKNSRLQLILLMLLFIMPLAASYWFYFAAPNSMKPTSKHFGHLLEKPQLLPAMRLQDINNQVSTLHNTSKVKEERKWSVLYYVGDSCADSCKKKVFELNQMYKLLGKEQERVLVLMVFNNRDAALKLAPELAKNAPNVQVRVILGESLGVFDAFFSQAHAAKSPQNKIYLLDPLNYWALWYEAGSDPHDLHKDLKKLLKTSDFG